MFFFAILSFLCTLTRSLCAWTCWRTWCRVVFRVGLCTSTVSLH